MSAGPRSLRRLAGPVVAAVVLLSAAACGDRHTGGLDVIRDRGEIRIAVRPGFFDSVRSTDGGDEQVQLRHLATRLGVSIRWLEARRHDELLSWLEEGRADLAVSRFSEGLLRDGPAAPTAAVEWVADYLVAQDDVPPPAVGTDGGLEVHVTASMTSTAIRTAAEALGLTLVAAPETDSVERLLDEVASGTIPRTVADSGLLERRPMPTSLQLYGPLVDRRPVVWAVRRQNLRLRRAIDDFLFAEQVLGRQSPVAACRDLPEIRAARVLRMVTRSSPTTCYVTRGGLEGLVYDLAVAFARGQRLRLELSIPPPEVDPLDWLEQGYGDFAALHEPMDPEREGRFLVSEPYRRRDLVAVVADRDTAAVALEDLAGAEVAASRAVAGIVRELPLEPPIRVAPTAPGADAFSVLKIVARGEVDAAVVDADAARLELDEADELRLGPVVLPDVPLVWVLNPSSPRLHEAVDGFLVDARRSGLVRQLAFNNLGRRRPRLSPRLPAIPDGDLTPYDEYLAWAARRYGLDWRLLASLMYEESRFDPDAVGPGGSAGLFQFMPFTWRELGVEDPHHPGEAIEAAARYLRSLMDKFADLDLPDRVAMGIASYNVGPRHVFDARRLALEMGLDRDRWAGNVETAMYILDDPEVARRFPAGACRCRRGAAYTRRILRRYAAYAEQFPP